MANPRRKGKTPTKGILGLGIRLSGSHRMLFPFPVNGTISTFWLLLSGRPICITSEILTFDPALATSSVSDGQRPHNGREKGVRSSRLEQRTRNQRLYHKVNSPLTKTITVCVFLSCRPLSSPSDRWTPTRTFTVHCLALKIIIIRQSFKKTSCHAQFTS